MSSGTCVTWIDDLDCLSAFDMRRSNKHPQKPHWKYHHCSFRRNPFSWYQSVASPGRKVKLLKRPTTERIAPLVRDDQVYRPGIQSTSSKFDSSRRMQVSALPWFREPMHWNDQLHVIVTTSKVTYWVRHTLSCNMSKACPRGVRMGMAKQFPGQASSGAA